MKVLFFTVAPIGSVSASGVYTDLLREFRDRGDDVYVVSPAERQYGLEPGLAVDEGISVVRVLTGGVTKERSLIRKGLATLLMERRFIRAIKLALSGVSFDLVMYTAPPVNTDRIVRFVKSKSPKCVSYLLLKDIFPQNAVDLGLMRPGGLIWRYFRWRERRLYAVSDVIGCMSAGNVKYLLEHNPGVNPRKVEVCPNSIKPAPFRSHEEAGLNLRRDFGVPDEALLLVYGGNLGVPQGVDFLIEVLDACRSRTDLFYVIVGSGTEYDRIARHLEGGQRDNVVLKPSMPRREYAALLEASDVGLILLDRRFTIPNFPSRLTAYLEAGVPVISATDENTDLGRVLETAGAGVGVLAGDVGAFMEAVALMQESAERRREMGRRGRAYLEQYYTVARGYEIITRHLTVGRPAQTTAQG